MKILALNWQDLKNPMAGGAEVHLEELLRRLVQMGHSVTLFCSSYPGALAEEMIEGVRIIRRGGRFNFNFIAPFHLRKLLRAEKFDIFIEDINKIPFYTPFFLSIPTLVVIPHLFASTVFEEINFVLGSYIYLAERPMAWVYRGRKFNVISESTAEDLLQRGIPAADISVVHCGIDRSRYSYDAAVAKFERPTVLYLGRIKKYKCVQHLIEAVASLRTRIPNIELIIVGAGDYMAELRAQVASLGMDDTVRFTGFVSATEKVNYLRRSLVCVCPSLKEGWGLTNIEANSCGTAVIAANVAGLRDSVRDNQTGLLYRHGDIEELAGKIERVVTNEEERRRLETGGLAWAERFNWDRAAGEFEKVMSDAATSVQSKVKR